MAAPSNRTQRVATLVREVLSELIRFEVKDPRVAAITLTDVEVTGDLREARVYYTAPEDEKTRKAIAEALRRASGFLRRELGQRIRLRVTPSLEFRLDPSLEYGARIERALHELGLGEAAAKQKADDEADDTGEPDDEA
jgi:ribosome-binding factor A